MSLVKARGNMYPFVSHTWNPIKGRCLHNCPYCYVKSSRAKRYYQGDPYLSEKELKVNLGENNYIFVGSMTDMWGDWIPSAWITHILEHCQKYPKNKYLFQSKNPFRFLEDAVTFEINAVWGTTIESDKQVDINVVHNRAWCLASMPSFYQRMVSIEPIMDFNVNSFVSMLKWIKPSFIVIGADSKGHNLPEPPAEKIRQLITELEKFTEVICKKNLGRLLK